MFLGSFAILGLFIFYPSFVMTKRSIGAVALSTLALSLFAGCANVQDQIAKKMAEGVVNQATGGKVTMDDANGGNITFKDKDGNVAAIGGGDKRPESAPADMPSLPGAQAFGWFGGKDAGVFSFTVANAEFKAACDQETAAVEAAGWAKDEKGMTMEFSGSKTVLYKKAGSTLTLTCSQTEGSKDVVFALTKGTDASSAGAQQ